MNHFFTAVPSHVATIFNLCFVRIRKIAYGTDTKNSHRTVKDFTNVPRSAVGVWQKMH